MVLSPVLFAASGDADLCNDPKNAKNKIFYQIFFLCNNSDTTGV